jgi:transposase
VSAHQQLHALFQRTDLLVTGDRIMQSAENMLVIARAHGRFLGPLKWTHAIRSTVAACREEEYRLLPNSSRKAGYPIKAVFRHLHFKVKEKLSDAEREQLAQQRRRRKMRGKTPSYRQVRFWMRATIILDIAKRKADAKRRHTCIQAYEAELKWTSKHLNKGRFYGDPEWVENHLAELSQRFKDVRTFVKVTFTNQDGVMSLAYQRLHKRIAQAAKLDGKWVLVTNQPPTKDQSLVDYMDWMLGVYKNHCHVERRMRNLKSNLPIRPIYLHRDEAIVALCFTCMVALMTYTLIERDCQSNPALVNAGLTTTDKVLGVLSSFCLSGCYTPSGYQVFWADTPTELHQLIWQQLLINDPGTRMPAIHPVHKGTVSAPHVLLFGALTRQAIHETEGTRALACSSQSAAIHQTENLFFFAIVKVLLVMLC